MKRRQLIRYGGVSLAAAIATIGFSSGKSTSAQTETESVTIEYLGHSCFLFTDNGLKVLVNPFRPVGCTAGYTLPDIKADLVLVSSFLLDEGAVEEVKGNPKIMTKSGEYEVGGVKFRGVTTAHDREGGRRFGDNLAWRWTQGGIDILHLGGAAAPLTTEEKIMLSGPDVLLIPVGGGDKVYNPEEAKQTIKILNPKLVIPTQYLTAAADRENCNLATVDDFLQLAAGMEVKKVGSTAIAIKPQDLPEDRSTTLVRVLDY